jgi:hypothetical protein
MANKSIKIAHELAWRWRNTGKGGSIVPGDVLRGEGGDIV